jgi:DNA-directed RNA polymerase alpha subunit
VINALLREHIETVADLVKVGKNKLTGMKGVGKKSIELIEEELKKMGIQLS